MHMSRRKYGVVVLAAALIVAVYGCNGASPTNASPGGDDAGTGGSMDTGSSGDERSADGGPGSDGAAPDGDGASPGDDAASGGAGDTTPCPAEVAGGVALAAGTPLANAITPNPIVSLNKPVTTTTANFDPTQLFRDPANPTMDTNQMWQPSSGDSVIIKVGTGFDELLVIWEIMYPDYVSQGNGFGLPYDYQIDVSPDGVTWKNVVARATSNTRSREARFSFTGQSQVRFTVPSTGGTYFSAMKIFDVSHGSDDTWLVAGSGPSRFVYDDLVSPGFGHLVNGCRPKYYPALINIADLAGGVSDLQSALTAPPASNWLALNPDFHFWLLNYGLADIGSNASDFAAGLEAAIKLLLAANKVPIVAHVQYVAPGNGGGIDPAAIVPFNAAIDQLVAKYKLLPAPDLYAWFMAHPDELCTAADDGNDPSGFCGESQWDGIEPINLATRPGVSDTIRMWAAAATAGGVYAK